MNLRTILGAVAVLGLVVPELTAQQPDAVRPAVIALVASLPDTASRVVVWRRAGGDDIILLREADATAEDLATAIGVLTRSRAVDGATLANTLRLRIQSARPVGETPRGLLERFEQTLRQIRRTPVADVPGIGPARSATIPMTQFRHRRA